jgi:hypothetical protein
LYRLNVESTAKFIEVKRKLAIQTNIYSNNQEWYLHFLSYSADGQQEEEASSTSYMNNLANSLDVETTSIEALIAEDRLFNIPLTLIVEEKSSLEYMCIYMDDLIHIPEESNQTGTQQPRSASINEASVVKMMFVVVNKTPQQQQRLTDYKGVIDDEDIEIDEDFPQPPPSMTIVDLTMPPSVEELPPRVSPPLVVAGTSVARPAVVSSTSKITDADYDEIVEDEEEHYDFADPSLENVEEDDDDVHFLAEETDKTRPKKHKGWNSTINFFLFC